MLLIHSTTHYALLQSFYIYIRLIIVLRCKVNTFFKETENVIKKQSVKAVDYWRQLKEVAINMALMAVTVLVTKLASKEDRLKKKKK